MLRAWGTTCDSLAYARSSLMNKFTIFTVIISVVIIATISELMVSDYLGVITKQDLKTNVTEALDEGSAGIQTPEEAASNEVILEEKVAEPISTEKVPVKKENEEETFDPSVAVTQEDLEKAGLSGLTLQSSVFDGKIFQVVDVSDVNVPVTEYHVVDDKNVYGIIFSAWFYQNTEAAQNFYELLKERSQLVDNVSVNETNQYGDASFFFNDAKRVGTAFLVVRIDNRVYAVSYPKASHESYKQFIGQLRTR